MNFLKYIKDFISYNEPSNVDQFELLEDDTEGDDAGARDYIDINSPRSHEDTNLNEPGSRQVQYKKSPLQINKWNQVRRREPCVAQDQNSAHGDDISRNLKQNQQRIEQEFSMPKNKVVVIRDIKIGGEIPAFLAYIDGMADRTTINDYILRPLMSNFPFETSQDECVIDFIGENILSINEIIKSRAYEETIEQILEGLTALFIEGCDECILIESRGYEKRSVEQPVTESVIVGPHEAFVENLFTNLTLIRRIIKNKNLITEILTVGKTNRTNCGIMYIDGIVNDQVVQEVKRRIESIDIDSILGIGMLEQLIEDHPLAIFPQILTTERPDRSASFLMEGKVIIICDGTPYASIVPVTFFHMNHTSEDAFNRWQYGSFLRLVRVLGFWVATFLPGLYLAITLFHQEMIPTELILAIAKSRENVPFPSIVEILLMEISFELIREAGVRVPEIIGNTLGIIGALILGQSAVAAHLVSPIMVIIVSITGLGNFTLPNYSMTLAVRIIKFIFIFLGAIAGFYGIAMGIFILGGFACSMKCFGVPYFAPIAPRTKVNPDVIMRQPLWNQTMRPDPSNSPNRKKAGSTVRGWKKESNKGDKK